VFETSHKAGNVLRAIALVAMNLTICLLPRPVLGQSRGVTQAPTVNCGDSATQAEMNQCFARESRQDIQLLDALLKKLSDKFDAPAKERLGEVQSQWIKYRDAHCKWQAAFFEGGSVQPMIYSTCISALTWNRIEELKLNLCEGTGMTGPCEASRRYDRPGLTNR
jgi:uncharacterized protein YecT (DUF1311 family)